MGANTIDTVGIMRIMELIPHRYPMLLIDRVDDIVPDVSATGIKAVSGNEPFFAGHFPGRPIMPGVLIVEAMAQTAAVHAILSMGEAASDKLVYFMTISEAKFRKPVEPGMLLALKIAQTKARGTIRSYASEAYAGDVLMAQAQFTAMIADRPQAA
jgi:3-hydroxyacyl-[acyl-carrier-protein] dehydratase